MLLYRAKKLGPGQYLDRSETGAAVPADLTQHPALPVSLKPLFPLITIYRHDVEYLKFSYLNDIFRFEVVLSKNKEAKKREYFMNQIFINKYFRDGTSGSTSLTGDNSQAKDVIIAGYDVQGFLGVRPAGQVVLHQQDLSITVFDFLADSFLDKLKHIASPS